MIRLLAAATLAVATAVPPPSPVCTLGDDRLAELSGMVVTDGEIRAASDGGGEVAVHVLDGASCAVTGTRTADVNPYDVEDLATGPDGTVWVSDTGDNELRRDTVAVIALPRSRRGAPHLHRLTYPDGPHDAEALLVDTQGRPLIVTKEVGRPAGLYRTADPPTGGGATPLLHVGDLQIPASDTVGGPIGGMGTRTVTGAAMSADGTVVAVRTYTDAWLYPVRDGDLVGALAKAPVRVPLPDEPQGEAIAFAADGTLLSASETRNGMAGRIRAVPGAAALVTTETPAAPVAPAETPPAPEPEPSPPWLPAALGGTAVVGVLTLLAAAAALRGARRR